MTTDLYSGRIDWDKIYRAFHNPSRIATRIQEELNGSKKPILFSGFQEAASFLTNKVPVTFVDHSSSITNKAKEQFPQLREVHTGDITQLAASLPAPNVVIACRISAYWDTAEYFERLANALQSFPREGVLIDFFDRDCIEPGQRITFESEEGVGEWVFLDLKEPVGKEPPFCRAKLKVSYSLNNQSFSYDGYRCFFRRDVLLHWSHTNCPDYNVTQRESLLDHDPSFTLKLVLKKEG